MRSVFLLTILLSALISCEVTSAQIPFSRPVYPLGVSANNRHLVDSRGVPVFFSGDAGWEAPVNLTRPEMVQYLVDRRSKGYNCTEIEMISKYGNQAPAWRNVYGQDPFTATLAGGFFDFLAPNLAYWSNVDHFIRSADSLDMVVFCFPGYCGWEHLDGWGAEINANGPDRCLEYGRWLGQRYAAFPNIIWSSGGDWHPISTSYELTDEFEAIKHGIEQFAPQHLWTAHDGGISGVVNYGYLGLDINSTYTWPPMAVPAAIRTDYERVPIMPFLMFEGYYENRPGPPVLTPLDMRLQAWHSVIGGAFGHFYGNWPCWYFGTGWQSSLNDPGSVQMRTIARTLRSFPWEDLVPDYSHQFLTAGYGTMGTSDFASAARTSDGEYAIAYCQDHGNLTFDLSQLSGSSVLVWCIDPQTGSKTLSGTYPTSSTNTVINACTPAQDFVLLFENAAQVRVAAKAWLDGAYDAVNLIMRDNLRTAGLVPLTEPYSAIFHHVSGGGETTTNAVLGVTGSNAIVDWVFLELRDAATPAIVRATRSALLQRDGDIVDTDGTSSVRLSAPPGNYRLAVRHRNHLGVMTNTGLALTTAPTTVDFRSASTITWGTNARKTVGTARTLWSGNGRPVKEVKYTGIANDRDRVLMAVGGTAPNSTVTGYRTEDHTLDGITKYTGPGNDRDPILVNVGNTTPNAVRSEQLP